MNSRLDNVFMVHLKTLAIRDRFLPIEWVAKEFYPQPDTKKKQAEIVKELQDKRRTFSPVGQESVVSFCRHLMEIDVNDALREIEETANQTVFP